MNYENFKKSLDIKITSLGDKENHYKRLEKLIPETCQFISPESDYELYFQSQKLRQTTLLKLFRLYTCIIGVMTGQSSDFHKLYCNFGKELSKNINQKTEKVLETETEKVLETETEKVLETETEKVLETETVLEKQSIHELENQLVKKINNLEINLEKLKKLTVCFDEINTSLEEIIDCYSYNFK
jgi:hypothetical protein